MAFQQLLVLRIYPNNVPVKRIFIEKSVFAALSERRIFNLTQRISTLRRLKKNEIFKEFFLTDQILGGIIVLINRKTGRHRKSDNFCWQASCF
jgi:hypothetical protein